MEGQGGVLEPELIPRQQLVTVPHAFVADKLTSPTVPIGTILDWYRPTPTTPIPEGYKICDGSPITDAASPFKGQNTPNLLNRFTYGVDASRLGETGGQIDTTNSSLNLSHNHTYSDVPAHTHTISDPGHRHNVDNYLKGWVPGQVGHAPGGNYAGIGASSDDKVVTGITVNATGVANPKTNTALGSVSVMPRYFGVLKIIRIK